MKITKEIREKVKKHILNGYEDSRDVTLHRNGAVSVYGRYPNSTERGKIFAGWIEDISAEIERDNNND